MLIWHVHHEPDRTPLVYDARLKLTELAKVHGPHKT